MKYFKMVFVMLCFESVAFAQLSKSDIEVIVQKYANACISGNFEAWKKLYYKPDSALKVDFKSSLETSAFGLVSDKYKPKNIRIREIDGLNIRVQIQTQTGRDTVGWIQLLPTGKVKYEPFVFEHPVVVALINAHIIETMDPKHVRYKMDLKIKAKNIEDTGVPLFGFSPELTEREREKSLDKIIDWLKDEGRNWDNSEPCVALPKRKFNDLLKSIK